MTRRGGSGGELVVEHVELQVGTLCHIKFAASAVFEFLILRGQLENNPMQGKNLLPRYLDGGRDERVREMPTNEEFATVIDWLVRNNLLEFAILYMAARMVGGMRTSDIHAWRWAGVDTVHWKWVVVPRPKTRGKTKGTVPGKHILPDDVAHLKLWWIASGRPDGTSPIFPAKWARLRQGFRKHLLTAGVNRYELTMTPRSVDGPASTLCATRSARR